jgi:hypothetical protein
MKLLTFLNVAACAIVLGAMACSSDANSGGGSGGGGGSAGAGMAGSAMAGSGMGGSGMGGSAPGMCPGSGAGITMLPSCSSPATATVEVPKGCLPTIDGVIHADEWNDGACFQAGDQTMYVKYAGDSLYMATSVKPTCGCGMPFYFDPNGQGGLDGDEFAISVFDDPFMSDGDRTDFKILGGMLQTGMAPAGIVTKCPMMVPSYEWKIPLSALGVVPGTAHAARFAFVHAQAHWPASLTMNSGRVADDPTTWGKLESSSWK